MKKNLLLFLLIPISFFCNGQNITCKDVEYSLGKEILTLEYDNQDWKKISLTDDPDNPGKKIRNYLGKPFNGRMVRFNPDCTLYREDYYENGQLWKKGTQKNGTWEGPYEQYFANGQISEKGTLKNGQWVGAHEEFYENGDKINFINEFKREYKESTGEEQRDMLLGCAFIFFIMYLVFVWVF